MHKLKLAAFALVFFLLSSLAIAIVLLVALDDEDYGRLASWGVERFTDYKLTINGSLSLEPSMTTVLILTDVTIEPDQPLAAPISAQVGQLTLQIAIKPLLSGTLLIEQVLAENADITFNAEGLEPAEKSERKLEDIDLPIVKHAGFKNINFAYIDGAKEVSHQLALHSFIMDDVPDRDPQHIQGKGVVNGTDFTMGGDIGSLAEAFDLTRPYPVDLSLQLLEFDLVLSGTIDDPIEGEGLSIAVSVEKTDLSSLLAVVGVDISGLGDLSLDATVIGDIESPGLSKVDMKILGGNGVEFIASGEIDNLISGAGANITFSGKAANKQLLKTLLSEEELSEISVAGDLYDEAGNYAIKNIQLDAANAAGTALKASGNMVLGPLALHPKFEKVDLDLKLSAANTASLRTYLFDWLPDAGPLSGTLHLSGSVHQLAIENLNVTVGEPKTVWVSVTGDVGQIPLELNPSVTGIDLSLSISAADAPQLVANFDLPLPALDKVVGKTRISGSSSSLSFEQIEAQLTDPGGVIVNLAGTADLKGLENPEPDFSYDLDADLKAENVTSFRRLLVATTLPDLGPVRSSAHVSGTTENILVQNLTSSAGNSKSLLFKTDDGLVKINLEEDEPVIDISIASSFFADNSSRLSDYLDLPIPELGPIEGKYKIVNHPNGYGVDDLVMTVGNQDYGRLQAKGTIEHLMKEAQVVIDGIALDVEINDLDWSAISGFVDQQIPDLGKLTGRFVLSGGENRLAVSKADLSSKSSGGVTIQAIGNINNIEIGSASPVDGVDVKLVAKIPDIDLFAGTELSLEGPLDINVQVTRDKGDLGLDGDIKIGKTVMQLSAVRNPDSQGPKFITSVASSKLYLADIGIYPKTLPAPDTSVRKFRAKKLRRKEKAWIFSDQPLPFEFLKENEFSLELDIAELVGTDFVLTDLDIDATLANSVLEIDPAKLTFVDGAISAVARIDASGSTPEIMFKLTAEDINSVSLFEHIPAPALMEGHLNVAAYLNSSGNSPRQIASSLTGELGVTLENGRIKKVADLVGADAFDLITTARSRNKYEKLNCMAIVFSFDKGIGTGQAMVIDTPKFRTNGMGTINLVKETIDIGLKPTAKRRGLVGSSPVQIKGRLSNPSITKLPAKEAVKLYGTIFLPFVFIPAEALGYVWHTMANDKLEPTPCLLEALEIEK